VANSKLAEGFQVWLFGDKEDASITKYIQDKTQNRCVDFAGKTTLKDAVVLLSKCNIVLTNDSGLMHVAAALDISLIAIYGSTSPGFTPPLSKKTVIFSSSLACSPCFKRECPLKSFSCMKETTTEKVLSAIKSMEM
jgi:heptosyltransferase-2